MIKKIDIVNAPFQLISSAASTNKIEEKILIIRVNPDSENRIPDDLCYLLKSYEKVFYIKSKSKFMQIAHLMIISLIFKIKFCKVELGLGEFRGGFCKIAIFIFNPVKISILDDGAASIALFSILEDGVYENMNSELKKGIYKKYYYSKKIKIKTFLKMPRLNTIKVENYRLKELKLLNSSLKKNKSEDVLVLGAAYVEKGIMYEKDYMEILKKVFEKYGFSKYYPHRAESDLKLNYLDKTYFNILKNDNLPIELRLLKNDLLPKKIITFQSAAVLSINELFPDIEIIIIHLDEKYIKNDIKNKEMYLGFKTFESYLKSNNFNFIEF